MFSYRCCTQPWYDLNVVYTRGSRDIPCKHPSLNDKLFRGQHKLNVLRRNCKDYKDYNFGMLAFFHNFTPYLNFVFFFVFFFVLFFLFVFYTVYTFEPFILVHVIGLVFKNSKFKDTVCKLYVCFNTIVN